MFSERGHDGIARSAEQWFKRHNPTAPAQGGARKSRAAKAGDWLATTRQAWEQTANRALEQAGRPGGAHRPLLAPNVALSFVHDSLAGALRAVRAGAAAAGRDLGTAGRHLGAVGRVAERAVIVLGSDLNGPLRVPSSSRPPTSSDDRCR